MADIPERNIEVSPLSGYIECADHTVQVQIFRFAGSEDEWTLEVVDHEGTSTVWSDTFASDEAAYEAFEHAVVQDGLGSSRDTAVSKPAN